MLPDIRTGLIARTLRNVDFKIVAARHSIPKPNKTKHRTFAGSRPGILQLSDYRCAALADMLPDIRTGLIGRTLRNGDYLMTLRGNG